MKKFKIGDRVVCRFQEAYKIGTVKSIVNRGSVYILYSVEFRYGISNEFQYAPEDMVKYDDTDEYFKIEAGYLNKISDARNEVYDMVKEIKDKKMKKHLSNTYSKYNQDFNEIAINIKRYIRNHNIFNNYRII